MRREPNKSLNNMVSVYDYNRMINLQANTGSEKLESKNTKVKKLTREVRNDKRKRY